MPSQIDPAAILQGVTDPVAVLDLEWRFAYINQAAADLLGRSPAELAGLCIWDLYPRTAGSSFYTACHRALAEQVPISFDQYWPGKGIWLDVRLSPSPEGLMIFSRDVTELKNAAEAARRGNELYRAFIEQAGEAFWLTDLDGRCLEVNHAACELLGYSREELVGHRVRDLFHPEDQGGRQDDLRRVHSGETVRAERRLRRKDGGYALVEGIARRLDAESTLVFFRDVTQRRAAEAALLAREQEFRAIFELAAVGAGQADPHTGRFLRVNRRLCEITGYTAAELLERTYLEITHPEDRPADQARLQAVFRGETHHWRSEKRYLRKDGAEIWVEVHGTLLRDAEGRPMRTLAIVQDVTEARRALESLIRSERDLRDAQRVAGLGSWCLELATGEAWWSEELYRIYGLEPGTPPASLEFARSITLPADWGAVQERVRLAGESGAGFHNLEVRVIRPDGSLCWALVQGEVERDAAGQPARLIGTVLDITERKLADQAVRDREERLRLATRAAGIGTFDWDIPTGKVVWDEQEELLFGLTPGSFRGHIQAWGEYVELEDLERVEGQIRHCLAEREEELDFEFRIRRPDGEVRWIEAASRFFFAEDGTALRMVGVNVDVTDRRRLAAELEARAAALAAEGRRKDEFLAMLAHELRNPLAPIVQATELIRLRGGDNPALQRQRETISRSVRHLSRLVDDLLEVARINEGKIELRLETVELGSLVRQAAASVRSAVSQRSHQLTVSVPEAPVYLHADPVRVVQIVTNLLTNAVKYTDPGGQIQLSMEIADWEEGRAATAPTSFSVQPPARCALVRVADSGRGIAPDLLPQIFDLFVQGEQTLARAEGGLGVGLTLVSRLAELHGGAVSAHSAGPGRGSEFTVRLPLTDLEVPAAERKENAGAEPRPVRRPPAPASPLAPEQTPSFPGPPPAILNPHPQRVLIVEDNVDAAETLGELLEVWGYEVRMVHNGPDALALLPAFAPDVVVMDIGLPGLDGYELVRHLRAGAHAENVRFIALTGYGGVEHRRRAFEAGFHHHLTKPLDPEQLAALLAAAAPAPGS